MEKGDAKVESGAEICRIELKCPFQVFDGFSIVAQGRVSQPEIEDGEHIVGADFECFLEFCNGAGEFFCAVII